MAKKITIELPDWADERHIYIMAGIELVAYQIYGDERLFVKTARCSSCGECCMNLSASAGMPISREGHCIYLDEPVGGKRECILGLYRPFGCSVGMQRKGFFEHPNCTVEYKVIK